VGLVTSIALTWGSTHAAFTASTGNVGNSWQAGSVALDHSQRSSALFTTVDDGALGPGSSRSSCIRLDYTGSLPADIRMYVGTPSNGTDTLDPYLVMSVERGADVTSTTTVAADCTTGFEEATPRAFLYNSRQADDPMAEASKTLADLKDTHPDHRDGVVVSTATPPDTYLTLRITYAVADDNEAQSKQSSATFTWEARNT
jgi:hypothetical protein